jgi:hypothetical protein
LITSGAGGDACSFPPPVGGLRPPFLAFKNADAERRLCGASGGEGGERSEPGGGFFVPCSLYVCCALQEPPTPDPSPPRFARGEGNREAPNQSIGFRINYPIRDVLGVSLLAHDP